MSSGTTDDFLDRCDDVLTDWQGSADSMRWNPDLPEDAEAPYLEGEDPVAWVRQHLLVSADVYDNAARASMRAQRAIMDMVLTGNAYFDARGNRIPPDRVAVSAGRGEIRGQSLQFTIVDEGPVVPLPRPGRVMVGYDPARALGPLAMFTRDTDGVIRVVTDMRQRITDGLREVTPRLREFGEAMGRVGKAFRDAGLIPTEPPTDPRERALWARRNRNTGPARDPFTHRGMTSDHRPVQVRIQHTPRRTGSRGSRRR